MTLKILNSMKEEQIGKRNPTFIEILFKKKKIFNKIEIILFQFYILFQYLRGVWRSFRPPSIITEKKKTFWRNYYWKAFWMFPWFIFAFEVGRPHYHHPNL